MIVQAILEIVFMLSVAAFLGYKIGNLIELKKTRSLRHNLKKKEEKVEELNFDLNHCVQVRRRLQSQLFDLQKRLEVQPASSQAIVSMKGTVVTPKVEAFREKKGKEEMRK